MKMEKTKGIVMRTSPKVTVIYTKKGNFLEVKTPIDPPVIGQVIEVNLNPRRLFLFFNHSVLRYGALAAAFLLVLSISAFYFLYIPNMAAASVTLDINNNKPVELSINKEGKVIKTPNVNVGSSILEGISPKGLDVYQTVDLILETALQKGLLSQTQNLVMANVVPINNKELKMIDQEKLRSTIRDEMTRRNLSGSVVVSQANQEIQQEANQEKMSVNRYLIYNRCQNKGIVVQPDTLRNDAQKALQDAKVTVISLFPEESFEVSMSNAQNGSQSKPPSMMGPPENHGALNPSMKQPSASTPSSNSMMPIAPSHPPVKQPMKATSPDMSSPSGSMSQSSSSQQPVTPSMTPSMGGMGH